MPILVGHDNRQEPRREQLLALSELRRDLEQLPPGCAAQGIRVAVTDVHLAQALHELIAALDRRLPRVGHAGEAAIARDAAALRSKALKRLAELDVGTRTRAP